MSNEIGSFLEKISTPVKLAPVIYSKKVLSNDNVDKLLEYQRNPVLKAINISLKKKVLLNNCDTGIGKTYMTIAHCKELGKRPIIASPKTVMGTWIDVCEYYNIEPYDIVNYETLKNAKTYSDYEFKKRIKSPYLKIIEDDPTKINQFGYKWINVPSDAILIFDEAHRCKNLSTENGKLLASTKQLIKKNIPVILLSATICEKFNDMKIPFYLFGIIPSPKNYNHYIKTLKDKYPEYKVKRKDFARKSEYDTAQANAKSMIIYKEVADFTVRIRISELGDRFPSNQWCAQQFIADEANEISELYKGIAVCIEGLRNSGASHHLAQIQKLKQEIELKKVPIFIEQAQLYMDEGKSVIIFVNYTNTLKTLVTELNIECIISGKQTLDERNNFIDLFQSNQRNIIICQMRAGNVGISLHDIHGGHPRAVLLNYPDSASDLLQALGRAARSGGKTPVIQRIIFVSNVDYEKKIMRNINRKLANISAINDGDLDGYKYKVVSKKKRAI